MIYVDVASWVSAVVRNNNNLATMNGIVRSILLLTSSFTPIVILSSRDRFFHKGLAVLSNELLKTTEFPVVTETQFATMAAVHKEKTGSKTVLIIPGPDQHSGGSFFFDENISVISVVHDTMAYDGVYSEEDRESFIVGVAKSDYFLPTSLSVRKNFEEVYERITNRELSSDKVGPYSNFVFFDPSVVKKSRELREKSKASLSVHQYQEYKNTRLGVELSDSLGYFHTHVGQIPEDKFPLIMPSSKSSAPTVLGHIIEGDKFVIYTALSDSDLREKYVLADLFICLSEKEGYSMPAMEAFLAGVPNLILSDIPVHRAYAPFACLIDLKDIEEWNRSGQMPSSVYVQCEKYLNRTDPQSVLDRRLRQEAAYASRLDKVSIIRKLQQWLTTKGIK